MTAPSQFRYVGPYAAVCSLAASTALLSACAGGGMDRAAMDPKGFPDSQVEMHDAKVAAPDGHDASLESDAGAPVPSCIEGTFQCDADGNQHVCLANGTIGETVWCTDPGVDCDPLEGVCRTQGAHYLGHFKAAGGSDYPGPEVSSTGILFLQPVRPSEDVDLLRVGILMAGHSGTTSALFWVYADALVDGTHRPGALLTHSGRAVVSSFSFTQAGLDESLVLEKDTTYWLGAHLSGEGRFYKHAATYDAATGEGSVLTTAFPWGDPADPFPNDALSTTYATELNLSIFAEVRPVLGRPE